MAELKPCPFCGGKAKREKGGSLFARLCRVICTKCEMSTRWHRTDPDVELWNERD